MHTQEGRSCLDVLQMAGSAGVHLTQGFKEGDGTSLAGGARDVEDPAPWGPISQGTAHSTLHLPFSLPLSQPLENTLAQKADGGGSCGAPH